MSGSIESLNSPAEAAAFVTRSIFPLSRRMSSLRDPHMGIQAESPFIVSSPEQEDEVLGMVDDLLQQQDTFLSEHPLKGRAYFSQPQLPSTITQAYDSLSEDDARTFFSLWVNSDRVDEISDKHHPKSTGLLLNNFVTRHESLISGIGKDGRLKKDDDQLIKKLVRIRGLQTVLDPREFTDRFIGFIEDTEDLNTLDKDEAWNLSRQVEQLAGVELFGYGFHTRASYESFNHSQLYIFLNQCTERQIPALEAANEDPDFIDDLMGKGNVEFLASLGLVGAQIKGNLPVSRDALERLRPANAKHGLPAYLKYFTASDDQTADFDKSIIPFLRAPIKSNWASYMLAHVLQEDKPLHPNSFLATSSDNCEFSANDILNLGKLAIDVTNGNLENLDPTIRNLLQKETSDTSATPERIAEIVGSCIGFGIDIPQELRNCFASHSSRSIAESIFSNNTERERKQFRMFERYPHNPMYELLFNGISVLPPSLKGIFVSDDALDFNTIAGQLLQRIFKDNYMAHYFEPRAYGTHYPEPQLEYKRVFREMWQVVHPDIWNLLRLADPSVIVGYIQKNLSSGVIPIQHATPGGGFGSRPTPLKECLPEDIYNQVATLHREAATQHDRIGWTVEQPLQKGKVETIHETNAYQPTSQPEDAIKTFANEIWRYVPDSDFGEKYSQWIFDDLLRLPNKFGIDLELFDPIKRQWIIIPHTGNSTHFPDDTALVVRDPLKFIAKYDDLAIIAAHRKDREPWYESVSPANIFRNATPEDFQRPERFLQRQGFQAVETMIGKLQEWTTVAHATDLQEQVQIHYEPSDGFVESQHEFHVALSADTPTDIDELPAVRYGVVEPGTAVVYAIQMPLIDGISSGSIEKTIEAARGKIGEAGKKILKTFSMSSPEASDIFGSLPEDIQQLSDPMEFISAFYRYAQEHGLLESIQERFMSYREKGVDKQVAVDYGFIAGMIQGAGELVKQHENLLGVRDRFDTRLDRMKRVNRIFKEEKKASNIQTRNIPSGPALSLALFCITAKSRGINTIQVPTYYPRRLHGDPEIDARILEQTANTVRGVSNLIEGVEIKYYPEEEDTSFHLTLGETLSSTNPVLTEAIDSLNTSNGDTTARVNGYVFVSEHGVREID